MTLDEELRAAFAGKRVLVTGHTGFKGSWLSLWLSSLGAEVTGLSLAPENERWLFVAAGIEKLCRHVLGDVRSPDVVQKAVRECRPHFVIHAAAQPLVRRSYQQPLETLGTNVMGTAHVLDALRVANESVTAVVVTSDKAYENREWAYGYREDEPMGGHDIYSMSKGATELLVSAWRRSFFSPGSVARHGVRLASARAGNVIGGGDWSQDRIVPDTISALASGNPIIIRSPHAVRPWQHVLEPLGGYLLLAARLSNAAGAKLEELASGWNFGPKLDGTRTVRELATEIIAQWGSGRIEERLDPNAPHEASILRLSIEKAHAKLGWAPRWGFEEAVARTVEVYRAQASGASPAELQRRCLAQIADYSGASV